MNDSERFLLIFSLTIFFGMMALGLMVIHGNSKTQQFLENLAVQERASVKQLANQLNCYSGEKFTSFIDKEKAEKPYRHFLKSTSNDGNEVDVYLDASTSGNGSFLVIESSGDKGCLLAKGDNMRMVLPEKEDAPQIRTSNPAPAVEAAQEVVEEAAEAVEEVVEEAVEAAEEAVEEAAESVETP
jgi:hypothetical protein